MACSGMRKDPEIQVIIQYIIQGLYYWCHKSGCPRNAIVSLILPLEWMGFVWHMQIDKCMCHISHSWLHKFVVYCNYIKTIKYYTTES